MFLETIYLNIKIRPDKNKSSREIWALTHLVVCEISHQSHLDVGVVGDATQNFGALESSFWVWAAVVKIPAGEKKNRLLSKTRRVYFWGKKKGCRIKTWQCWQCDRLVGSESWRPEGAAPEEKPAGRPGSPWGGPWTPPPSAESSPEDTGSATLPTPSAFYLWRGGMRSDPDKPHAFQWRQRSALPPGKGA